MQFTIPVLTLLAHLVLPLAQAAGPQRGLDVSDVSILFPVDSKTWPAKAYPDIKLGNTTAPGKSPLLTRSMFDDQLMAFGHQITESPNHFDYGQWRVVALRFDPCVPALTGTTPGCLRQIRLVAQPLAGRRGGEDLALHLLYKIGQGALAKDDPVVFKLKKIRDLSAQTGAPTAGLPLAVHPGLQMEFQRGQRKSIGQLVHDLILTTCNSENLMELAFTSSNPNMDGPWFFFSGLVHGNTWQAAPIAQLPGPTRVQQTFFDGSIDIETKNPELTAQSAEDPRLRHPHDTDCASCHLAARQLLEQHRLHSTHGFQNPIGVTGFVELALQPEDFSNVRAFGYLLERPTVAPITANSSALIAQLINRTQGWASPTDRDCSSPVIRDCFSGWSVSGDTKGTALECFRLCR